MLHNDLAPALSLDGEWEFALGNGSPWGTIQVSECWEAQGYSKWVDGPAHYRKQFMLPDEWAGLDLYIELGAVSYACSLYCNGQAVGEHRGLWTPFAVNLGNAAKPGLNTIELIVHKPGLEQDATYPMREALAGFLPDVATTFGGIWQSVIVLALAAGFSQLWIKPDPADGTLHIQAQIVVETPVPLPRYHVQLDIVHAGKVKATSIVSLAPGETLATKLQVPEWQFWTPSQPVLYSVRLQLRAGDTLLAECNERAGFRRLEALDEQLHLNRLPICLRGLLSWGWEPDRIAPFYTPEQARDLFRRVRSLGFNLLKLCLFVPNRVFYDIADEEGMLLWQEWPMWLPEVTAEFRHNAPTEYAEYMELTCHHPSVVIYSLGCELSDSVDEPLLRQLDQIVRHKAHGALICDNSGSSEAYGGAAVDLADFTDYHTYGDLQFLTPMLDHWRREWGPRRPWIFGEFCDSDGFRDLQELITAHGSMRPWWLTSDNPTHTWRPEVRALLEAESRLAAADLPCSTADLVNIAQRQSLMVRKVTLETVRSRAYIQGYVITGLRDTPIATSGIFDDFGRSKWTDNEFRPFNDDAILALEVRRSRIWKHGGDQPERWDVHNWWAEQPIQLHIVLNHTAAKAVQQGRLSWHVGTPSAPNQVEGSITLEQQPIPAHHPVGIAAIELSLPVAAQAQQWELHVQFSSDEITACNRWPLWTYPQPQLPITNALLYDPVGYLEEYQLWIPKRCDSLALAERGSVLVTPVLDEHVSAHLERGGRVLLLQTGQGYLPVVHSPFWRESLKLLAPHPLWQSFPHQGFADLQFWGLATSTAFVTSHLIQALPNAAAITPILRRLDAREFTVADYLFECSVGAGRLVACALRLHGGLGSQPTGLVRNVAGGFLLAALVDYLHQADPTSIPGE